MMVLRCVTLRAKNSAAVHSGRVKVQTRNVYMESEMSKSDRDEKTYKKWSLLKLLCMDSA